MAMFTKGRGSRVSTGASDPATKVPPASLTARGEGDERCNSETKARSLHENPLLVFFVLEIAFVPEE